MISHASLNILCKGLFLIVFSPNIPLESCMCLSVSQFPADLFLQPGESLNMTCSHYDKKYDKIYWYQQVNQQSLELIGFLNFKKPQIDNKGFSMSGDAEKEGYLTAQSVTADYSALYFCALSATVLNTH